MTHVDLCMEEFLIPRKCWGKREPRVSYLFLVGSGERTEDIFLMGLVSSEVV